MCYIFGTYFFLDNYFMKKKPMYLENGTNSLYYNLPKLLIEYNNVLTSDVEPETVGSVFIWVRESGSTGIKWREN